jgi:DNA-binding NarL/FixJ family response regulator
MKNFLLIDDHDIVRAGMKYVILSLFSPCQVFEARDEASSLTALKEQGYHLIIMDVHMPNTNTFGLLDHIRIHYPDTGVLVYSVGAENIYAKKFLQAGASGFISKNAGLPELQKAIESCLNKKKYISAELAAQLANNFNASQSSNPFQSLTPKELEIATLLMEGNSVTGISNTLHISTSTVGTHKANILRKLNAGNLMELKELARQYNV